MPQQTAPIELEHAYVEFDQTRAELQHAQSNFDLAARDYIDIAAYDLRIAEERTDNSLRKIRLLLGQTHSNRIISRQIAADKHRKKLYDMLTSDSLSDDGRDWLVQEIVDMERDMEDSGLVA
jgi:hypothetical protein